MESALNKEQKFFAKTLTLSFQNDDDCIVIDVLPKEPLLPKTNLNGTFIDLTDASIKTNDELKQFQEINPLQNSIKKRTLELDMMIGKDIEHLSNTSPKKIINEKMRSPFSKIDINQNNFAYCQPSTSQKMTIEKIKEAEKSTTSKKSLEFSFSTNILKELSQANKNSSISVYERLLEIGKKKLITNYEDFVCSLCMEICEKEAGVILKHCLHSFCRPCLILTINTKAEYGTVKCPFQKNKCDLLIDDGEIQELLGPENYELFIQNVILSLEEIADQNEKAKKEEESEQSLIPLLLNMDDLKNIPNLKPFECSICFTETLTGEGVVLKNCLHQFCKQCLKGCIEAAEEFEVKCPYIHPDNVTCTEFLQEREVRSLVSEEIFNKHLQKSLNVAENANEFTFHCQTPNCPAFVEIDQEITNFICQACRKTNCIKCKAIHEGKNCIDYQEEMNPGLKDRRMKNEILESQNAIEKMVADGQAMYCPRCRIPVMKISGCDFIMCTACKLGICWCTKKPRQSFTKANGILVEGCKCGEKGKKCSPNCTNCH